MEWHYADSQREPTMERADLEFRMITARVESLSLCQEH